MGDQSAVQDNNNLSQKYLERILKARVYDVAVETPLEPARNLSKRLGNQVLFKREDLQPVFSFKLRGAYNKLAQLPPDLLKKGVACSSAGNHAQGVALASKKLGCEALIAVEIPERPGSFRAFCGALGRRNVTEFNYRLGDPQQAKIFVGVELHQGLEEKSKIIQELRGQGYPVTDMSDNEVAKLHLRHMVGGSSPQSIEDERLYRFEFPERPGALMDFLMATGDQWNISLFHYRNHGSDYGRVLAGIQIPKHELERFHQHTRDLGYPFTEETDNQALGYPFNRTHPGRQFSRGGSLEGAPGSAGARASGAAWATPPGAAWWR